MIVVAPRFASDAATFSVPQPKGSIVDQSLSEARGAYSNDDAYQEQARQKILDELNQEFLLAGSWLNHIRKENDPNLKFFDKDDALEGLK